MTRALRLLPLASLGLLVLVAPPPAAAQFQSCVFCDVNPLNPDPFPVVTCQTGTSILTGIGFRSMSINGCSSTPVNQVRSTRPDRVIITRFLVRSDTQIEFDWAVPCNATSGLTGIDVTIDDNPNDTIIPYACGNLRMHVIPFCGNGVLDPGEDCDDGNTIPGDGCSATCREETITLSVQWDTYAATRTRTGVRVSWRTLAEEDTVGFEVMSRSRTGDALSSRRVEAMGPGRLYSYVDDSPSARQGAATEYRLIEITTSGAGDATPWFPVRSFREATRPGAGGGVLTDSGQ